MVEPLRKTLEAMPEPRLVISLGDCAHNCGNLQWRLRRRRISQRRRERRRSYCGLSASSGSDRRNVEGSDRAVNVVYVVTVGLAD